MPFVKLPSAWLPIRCDHQRGRKALAAKRAMRAMPNATSTVTGRGPRSSGSGDGGSGGDAIPTSLSRHPQEIVPDAASTSLKALRPRMRACSRPWA